MAKEKAPKAPKTEPKSGMCECGSNMVAQGATMCLVCKALYDRDKKKAKAKAKAKMNKAKKKILKDKAVQSTIEQAVKMVLALVGEQYKEGLITDIENAVIIAQIAHMLNQTLPTNNIEVTKSLIVSGEDTSTGCRYLVHPA